MMKIKGHTIHSMLVHFPSALFPLEFLSHGVFLLFPDPGLAAFCFYALILGSAMGWLAALVGLVDLLQLSQVEENPSNLSLGKLHGGIQGLILCAYTILTFIQFKYIDSEWILSLPIFVIKLPIISGLILANFFGAELFLKILRKEWTKTN